MDFNSSIKADLTDISGYKTVNKSLHSGATECKSTKFPSEQLERLKLMVRVKAPPLQRG